MATTTERRSRGTTSRLAVLGLALATLLTGAIAGPASAATPKMTVGIAPITDEVQSGSQVAYRITYECSNITADDCVAPVITMPRPVGVDPNGADVPAIGAPAVRGNADLVSSTGVGDEMRAQLKDLKPGTTGELTVSWNVPNYTTLPGTEYPGEVEIGYRDGSGAGGDQQASATTPNPIVTKATGALTVVKQTVTPDNEAKVVADQDVTYKIYACLPQTPNTGALDYKDLTIVDTLPKGTVFVSATGGGVYDAAAETVTWGSNPTPARNNCNNPTESYEVTVRYPASAFVPPAADPQQTKQIVNRVHATATALDGTALTADGSQTHNFIGPPLSGGADIVYSRQKSVTDTGKFANTNTSNSYTWSLLLRWYDNAVGGNPDFNRRKTAVAYDRLPCLVGGVAESPGLGGYSENIGTSFPGTNLTVPADQCTNPAFKTRAIRFGSKELASYAHSAQIVTWDGTTSRVHTWTKPAGQGDNPFGLYMYGVPDANPDNYSFNLAANEIVTDFRVAIKDLPEGTGVGQFLRVDGVNSDAFAASGLLTMTNSYRSFYSTGEYAPGAALPTSGTTNLAQVAAQQNFFQTQPDPQVRKSPVDPVTALKPGDETRWRVTISNGPNGNIPMNPRLVDVLPAGLEYVDGSASWSNLGALGQPTLTQSTVLIGGVERTRLTWNWPDGTELKNGDPSPQVEFKTRVTLNAASGTHDGDDGQVAVLFDRDTNLTDPGTNAPTDKWDLDGDGNSTEVVGQASVGWTVLPSSGASIEKWVKGANDADWTKSGLTNATFDGSNSQVDYRIQVSNPNTLPLTDLAVYDVFPHLGDTAIGESLAGVARGTEWAPTFAGITSLPAGATVQYSTSTNPCRPELFGGAAGEAKPTGCANTWTSTVPADPSTVQALRVLIPRVDPAANPVNIEFRTQAPALSGPLDAALWNPEYVANNNVAWHTFRTDGAGNQQSLPAAEAPAVSVRRAAGLVGDRVWLDANRNGLQDPGEDGVAGIVVELRDAAGNPVLDTNGDPIRTTTDADGNYSFVVPLGEWSVAFIDVPAKYQFTTPKVGGDDAKDSDATAIGAATHTVTVSDPIRNGAGANFNRDLDAGLVLAEVTIAKDDGKTIVRPGEETTYTVTVTNTATAAEAQNVKAVDTLPAELEFVSASDSGAYDSGAHTVTWDLGTIAAGASKSVTVTAKVKADVAPDTDIANTAKVEGPCTVDCESTDIDKTPPRVTIEKDDHKTVVGVGEQLTYDVTVKNHSDKTDATGVIVTDTLPAQLEFVSASNGGVYDAAGHTVTWDLGTLAKEAEVTLQVTGTVKAATPAGDTIVNTAKVETDEKCVVAADCEDTDTDHTPDIGIEKDDHRVIVKPGEETTYDVTVTNRADYAATGVIATDTLPDNTEFVSASDGGVYDAAKHQVTWSLGELAGKAQRVVQITVKVKADTPTDAEVVNVAAVTTDQGCIGDDCESTDIDKTPPRVTIEKDDHQDVVGIGQELTYDIVVTNHSDKTAATEVVVSDRLPEQLDFQSASDGGSYSAVDRTVTWNLGDLDPGQSKTVRVSAKVNGKATAGGNVVNTAKVGTKEGCIVAKDCEDTDTDHLPDVRIVKDDHKTVVKHGEQLTYDVTITNRAKWDANGVVATDQLPGQLRFVSASDGGVHDAAANTVTWKIGDLAAGESKTVKVTVTVKDDAPVGEITNTAKVTTDHGCIDSENGSCTTTDIDRIEPPAGTLVVTGGTGLWVGAIAGGGALLLGLALVLIRRRRQAVTE